ncbi:MAG: toll/interleukin-1 receptor domain-containing protein [Candidatus Thiodiazotropha sp.]
MMNNFTLAHAKQIIDLNNLVCERLVNSSNNETERYSLADLQLPDFCVNKTQNEPVSSVWGKSAFAALGTVLIIIIISVVTFGIGFRHREFLKVWCFVKFGWNFFPAENKDEANRSYDAFVSYSGHDEKFIIRELVPYLEEPKHNRDGFKLCLHHRDFPVGAAIAETIISAVQTSKRIVIILSDNFLKSEWCQYEFQTAHHQLLQEKKNRIIMILLHDINPDLLDEELKLYLKTCTYVQYGDRWLWPKIEYAMPKQNRVKVEDFGAYFTEPETENTHDIQKVEMTQLDSQFEMTQLDNQFEMTQLDCQFGDKIELIA